MVLNPNCFDLLCKTLEALDMPSALLKYNRVHSQTGIIYHLIFLTPYFASDYSLKCRPIFNNIDILVFYL
jgi:hypothetical protein